MKKNNNNIKSAKNLATVKKQKSAEVTKVDIRKSCPLTEDELHRKEAKKKNNHCPYRIKHVWDAEKGKYVKVKVYKKRIKMNKKELETFFGHKFIATKPAKTQKLETRAKAVSSPKPKEMPKANPAVVVNMRGVRLVWDSKTLKYKYAA